MPSVRLPTFAFVRGLRQCIYIFVITQADVEYTWERNLYAQGS